MVFIQREGLVITYSSLQLIADEVALPPGQIRLKKSLISNIETIDKLQISQIKKNGMKENENEKSINIGKINK